MSLALAFTALALSTATGVLAQSGSGGSNLSSLDFQPCPELNANITAITGVQGATFDCATLSVPLDYTDPQSGPLDLHLFKLNATEEPVLGTVLINFGGPGGTGAENLPTAGDLARVVIGPQWNIVSWDPRGTGLTIPFICDLDVAASSPTTRKRDIGTLVSANLTEIFNNGGWELAGAAADYCAQAADNETATLIGTVFTARDMMQIVDALGEDGLLRYYGWSYGTALGSYAAAMFPERVERMVLDANVNPHDYAAGHLGVFADDIDEAFAGFVQTCFDVGNNSALYSLLQPSTPQDILDAINLALAPLAENATTGPEGFGAYLAVKALAIQPLYFPTTWPTLDQTIASLLNGTVSEPTNETAPEPYGPAQNAVIGIRASDATFIANSSNDYLPIVQYQATVSPGFSDIAYFSYWISARWSLPAKERYWGDFRATTKTPILYVNGEFDPVTPLVNAYNGSEGFTGSVVLPHNGYGHGVFVAPSQCVHAYVQAYFLNGSLPEDGAYCETDATPTEVWLARVQAASNDSSSGAGGNGTSSESSNNSSPGQASENTASRQSSGAIFGSAAVLTIVALCLL